MNIQVFLDNVNSKQLIGNKSEMVIETRVFSRITKYYSESINLLGCIQLEINIVEVDGLKVGVLFYEYSRLKNNLFHSFLYVPSSSVFFRKEIGVDEFWFVLIEENSLDEVRVADDFVDKFNLRERYDKVFVSSYSNSVLSRIMRV